MGRPELPRIDTAGVGHRPVSGAVPSMQGSQGQVDDAYSLAARSDLITTFTTLQAAKVVKSISAKAG